MTVICFLFQCVWSASNALSNSMHVNQKTEIRTRSCRKIRKNPGGCSASDCRPAYPRSGCHFDNRCIGRDIRGIRNRDSLRVEGHLCEIGAVRLYTRRGPSSMIRPASSHSRCSGCCFRGRSSRRRAARCRRGSGFRASACGAPRAPFPFVPPRPCASHASRLVVRCSRSIRCLERRGLEVLCSRSRAPSLILSGEIDALGRRAREEPCVDLGVQIDPSCVNVVGIVLFGWLFNTAQQETEGCESKVKRPNRKRALVRYSGRGTCTGLDWNINMTLGIGQGLYQLLVCMYNV